MRAVQRDVEPAGLVGGEHVRARGGVGGAATTSTNPRSVEDRNIRKLLVDVDARDKQRDGVTTPRRRKAGSAVAGARRLITQTGGGGCAQHAPTN
jgi:hypothetical protein